MLRLLLEAVKEWVEEFAQTLIDMYGLIFTYDIMPSNDKLCQMANDTIFRTRGFYAKDDCCGGYYIIKDSATLGCLVIESTGLPTKYLCALDSNKNYLEEINVCRYGIRSYNLTVNENISPIGDNEVKKSYYAIENSRIISQFTNSSANAKFRSILRFPRGRFYFAEPINLVAKQLGIVGDNMPVFSSAVRLPNYNLGTTLCFPWLANGETAITVNHGIVKDVLIYGNINTYDFSIDRSKLTTDKTQVVNEFINTVDDVEVKCTGLRKTSAGVIQNVVAVGFNEGIHCNGTNSYVSNCYVTHCHNGAYIGNDVKVRGLYGYDVHTGLVNEGSLSSVIQLRVDSCVHLMRLINGKSCTFIDLDGDFCTDSPIVIGLDEGWKEIQNNSFIGIHARGCTLNYYDSAVNPNGISASSLSSPNGYGLVRVENKNSCTGNRFIINATGDANPTDDNTSTLRCPAIIFTYGSNGTITGNVFDIAYSGAILPSNIKRYFMARGATDTLVRTYSGTYRLFADKVTTKTLEATDYIPTATSKWLGVTFMLTAPQTGYTVGGIYKCVLNGSTYSWEQINAQNPN